MSFATPLALLFFALFLPTILLYLLKQRRRRVEVSTLMFWDKILKDEQTVTSLSKLKKLLSLLLQLLFIALLTLALARPLMSGRLTGARRIVLLIDTSASMLVTEGAQSRFESARRMALDVVRGMSIGDSLMAVSVAADPEIIHPFSDHKKDLREAIQKLQPEHSETNFKKAFKLLELLPADDRQTHVYMVSDGAFEPLTITPPSNTRFAFLSVGKHRDNIGITAFQVRPLPSLPRDFQVHIEVANHTKTQQKVPVELRINGRLTDAYEFTIGSGQSITRSLRQFSPQGGQIEVVLGVNDAFTLDNHAYALLPPPKPIKVRLVTESNLFLERALATDDEVELELVSPAKYSESGAPDVTVFSGWRPARTPPGNTIFVADWPDDLGLRRRGELVKPVFTEWQRDHPINRHLALQNVTIEKCAAVEPAEHFQKLAASFDDPLVLLREDSHQKVLVTTFDTTTTDLPLRVAFPILMANSIRYLGQIDTAERWMNPPTGSILTANELMRFMAAAGVTNATALSTIIDPEARHIPLNQPTALLSLSKSGVYQGQTPAGETFPLLAANLVSPTESRIEPAETLPVRSNQGDLAQIQQGFRLGFEPWFFLVAVGLLLSTIEWGLFHRRVIE